MSAPIATAGPPTIRAKLRGTQTPVFYLASDGAENGSLELNRRDTSLSLPPPPPHLMQYGETVEHHLSHGKRDSQILRDALSFAGYAVNPAHHILDFACSNGRVIRWLTDWATLGAEIWGVDINAHTVQWAQTNLSPPFFFAVTTTAPHLPFEDRYFNVVYCYSIFTHIDDLLPAWLQELRRVIAIGGFAYITIHDEDSAVHASSRPSGPFLNINADPAFKRFAAHESDLVSVLRAASVPQVFITAAYFESLTRPWFTQLKRIPNTMGGFQAAFLLRRDR